jgi:hypothetical protein
MNLPAQYLKIGDYGAKAVYGTEKDQHDRNQTNKMIHLAVTMYYLKKLLKFIKTAVGVMS